MKIRTLPDTFIWSEEYRAYWRPHGCGYTTYVERAGTWTYADAEHMTRHCGPEKQIRLLLKHESPEFLFMQQRREKVAIALWHRFSPNHRLSWDDEPRKAEYLDAAKTVAEILGKGHEVTNTGGNAQ